jgi:hypothetical protein
MNLRHPKDIRKCHSNLARSRTQRILIPRWLSLSRQDGAVCKMKQPDYLRWPSFSVCPAAVAISTSMPHTGSFTDVVILIRILSSFPRCWACSNNALTESCILRNCVRSRANTWRLSLRYVLSASLRFRQIANGEVTNCEQISQPSGW